MQNQLTSYTYPGKKTKKILLVIYRGAIGSYNAKAVL